MAFIGIDVGGTKINAGLFSKSGELISFHNRQTNLQAVMEQIVSITSEIILEAQFNICAIGVATAGKVDVQKGVITDATPNLPNWTGTDVKGILEDRFSLPAVVDNDANMAAYAEGVFGAGKGFTNYVCVTLGTGVGAGVVVNGQLVTGSRGGGGEVGHMILHPGGRPCNCGMNGCFEQYVSGTALQASISRNTKLSKNKLTPRELFSVTWAEDNAVKQIKETFYYDLVLGLQNIQAVIDPELIVLGGGVVDSSENWWNDFLKVLDKSNNIHFQIKKAELKNHAGMLGAAALAGKHIESTDSSL
ncbi:ROK family protein [Mesobacillus foraminis]|uniref:ROK family protein n=1 Tax=Mesobacillus foraminis TaxID=279826 RepID=UPI001BE515AB|nr:ROK family protein [Mesobacillus foraminis]MBT2758049.1 ROK family protein [Mesobacillus foraminis]